MSGTAPVYAFLAAAMLTLCTGFLTWWLAVVVVSMARQVPWTQAWLKRLTGSGGAASAGPHGAVRLLFTAPTRTLTTPSVSASVNDGTAVAAAAGSSAHLSRRDTSRDRGNGAAEAAHHDDGVTKVAEVPFGVDVADSENPGSGHDEVDFATVNPLRAKRGQGEGAVSVAGGLGVSGGGTGSVALGSSAGSSTTTWRQPGLTASAPSDLPSTVAPAVPGPPTTDRGRRVWRARLPVPGHQ